MNAMITVFGLCQRMSVQCMCTVGMLNSQQLGLAIGLKRKTAAKADVVFILFINVYYYTNANAEIALKKEKKKKQLGGSIISPYLREFCASVLSYLLWPKIIKRKGKYKNRKDNKRNI